LNKWKLPKKELRDILILIGITCAVFSLSLIGISIILRLNVMEVFNYFFTSTLGSEFGILSMLRRTTYLLIVSLGLCVAFRAGVWNLGGEGQILLGSLVTVGICLEIGLPPLTVIPLAFIASFLIGGGWGLIAGILKVKWGVNEMIVTMMMNFVATATMIELAGGPWRDPVVLIAKTKMIAQELRFPFILYPLNTVFLIALALIPVVHILVEKTVLGYEMRVVGGNISAATYAGINAGKVIMICMFLSGGICALAGTTLIFGQFFSAEAGISGMYGFYAIVCTLLGGMRPKMMFFTSILVSFILTGTSALRVLGIPGGVADVMIGLMFVMAALPELLARRRFR